MSFNSENELKRDDFIKNTYKFGEICEVLNGRAYKKNELLESGKYTVLRVGNFFSSDNWYYSDLELDANKYCDNGDLLFAWSASFGPKIWDGGKVIYHYHIWKLVPSPFVDKKFLYYWLLFSRSKMLMGVHGSVMGHLTKSSFEKQKISLPDILEQKAIAHILSTLDDKIEVNNQINKTLENMAQAIFKQWFVDFEFPNEDGEPYKSSGGEMVESELGLIPKGWEVREISDFAEVQIGGDWGKDEYFEGAVPVICLRGTDLQKLKESGYSTEAPIRWIKISSLEKRLINETDILLGGSGLGPVGRSLCAFKVVNKLYKEPVIYSNFCKRIRAIDMSHSIFIEHVLELLYSGGEMNNYVNGTSVPNLDLSGLMRHKIVAPTKYLIKMFSDYKELFFYQKFSNQNQILGKIRDTLLPKLMSGEIRVPLDEEGDVS